MTQVPIYASYFLLMKVYCLTSDEVSSTWNTNRDAAEQYTQDMWVRVACQSELHVSLSLWIGFKNTFMPPHWQKLTPSNLGF